MIRSAALAGALALPGAVAQADPGMADLFRPTLPESLQVQPLDESRPPSVDFRRDQARAVEAPTRYRTESILRYTKPLGDTGLVLRLKAPLKPTKLVKFEIRF